MCSWAGREACFDEDELDVAKRPNLRQKKVRIASAPQRGCHDALRAAKKVSAASASIRPPSIVA